MNELGVGFRILLGPAIAEATGSEDRPEYEYCVEDRSLLDKVW